MKDREIIGSMADSQMDIFWEEYKAKLSPTLKLRPQEQDYEDKSRPFRIDIKIQLVKEPSLRQRIKPFIYRVGRFMAFAWPLVIVLSVAIYCLYRTIVGLLSH